MGEDDGEEEEDWNEEDEAILNGGAGDTPCEELPAEALGPIGDTQVVVDSDSDEDFKGLRPPIARMVATPQQTAPPCHPPLHTSSYGGSLESLASLCEHTDCLHISTDVEAQDL